MKILIFYSGGKDSQACLIHSIQKYGVENCEAVFCDTGWENPMTYNHIQNTTDQFGVRLVVVRSIKYKNGMLDMAKGRKRFPSTKARFCTQELKMMPAIDYVLSHTENLICIEGIRKNESLSRSMMNAVCTYFRYYFEPTGIDKKGKPIFHTYRKKEVIEWCKTYNADKLRPIFDWTAEKTLTYILENGQNPNPLYYLGFKRVGCFPCIMCSHSEIKLIINNFPERIDLLRKAEDETNSSFFKPDYIPKRFCTGVDLKGNKYPKLDDVVKYIQGDNLTIDMFQAETPSCMSVYNLCE